MATVKEHINATTGLVSYKVRWWEGGKAGAYRPKVTLHEEQQALDLKMLVERAGEQWPDDDILRAFGLHRLCRADGPNEPKPEPAVKQWTFGVYGRAYIDAVLAAGQVNGQERRNYVSRFERHVEPYFGHRPVEEITKAELRLWQNTLAAAGKKDGDGNVIGGQSPKSILNIRGTVVSPVFKAACDDDNEYGLPKLRDDNPMLNLKAPKVSRIYRPLVESMDEAALLIDGMYATRERYGQAWMSLGDMVSTMLCASMRPQEAVAMPVQGVNFNRRVFVIYQVMQRPEKGGWIVVPEPKTAAGYREIPIPDALVDMLKERCAGKPPQAFVFSGPTGGHWKYGTLRKRFNDGVARAQKSGLPKELTMRLLRGSGMSNWREGGMDFEAIRQLAGHESITTTSGHYFGRLTTADMDRARTTMAPLAGAAMIVRQRYRADVGAHPTLQ